MQYTKKNKNRKKIKDTLKIFMWSITRISEISCNQYEQRHMIRVYSIIEHPSLLVFVNLVKHISQNHKNNQKSFDSI